MQPIWDIFDSVWGEPDSSTTAVNAALELLAIEDGSPTDGYDVVAEDPAADSLTLAEPSAEPSAAAVVDDGASVATTQPEQTPDERIQEPRSELFDLFVSQWFELNDFQVMCCKQQSKTLEGGVNDRLSSAG